MRKKMLLVGTLMVLMLAVCVNARAEEVSAWQGFWNSVGGFVYNAMPWNWGNWWGK